MRRRQSGAGRGETVMAMRRVSWVARLLLGVMLAGAVGTASAEGGTMSEQASLDATMAGRFAELALACVHREYPNHVMLWLNSDADAQPPRKLHPAFYGCLDWHSSVHGHWLLVRLLERFPDAPFAARARKALGQSLTTQNIAGEVAYFQALGG